MLPRNISQINNTIDLVESGIFFQVFQLLISPVLNHTHLQLKLLLISRDMMPAIKKHVHDSAKISPYYFGVLSILFIPDIFGMVEYLPIPDIL